MSVDTILILAGGVLVYFCVVQYLYEDRYVVNRSQRFCGLLSFTDKQANWMIALWPLTLVVAIMYIVLARTLDAYHTLLERRNK